MRFEDQRLLLAWVRLQAEILVARNPTATTEAGADAIPLHQTSGYRLLRAWFARLSPKAQVRARSWLQSSITGTRMALAKARLAARVTGEPVSMADLEIDFHAIEGEGPK